MTAPNKRLIGASLTGLLGLALLVAPRGGAGHEPTPTKSQPDDAVLPPDTVSYRTKLTVESCLQSQGVGAGFYFGNGRGGQGDTFVSVSELGDKTVTFTYHAASGEITSHRQLEDGETKVKRPSSAQRETLNAFRSCLVAAAQ